MRMMNILRNLDVGDVLIVAYILLGSVLGNGIVGRTVRHRTMPIHLFEDCILG